MRRGVYIFLITQQHLSKKTVKPKNKTTRKEKTMKKSTLEKKGRLMLILLIITLTLIIGLNGCYQPPPAPVTQRPVHRIVDTTISDVNTANFIDGGIFVTPVVADLDIRPNRITETTKLTFPLSTRPDMIDLRRQAIANAILKADADVLIEPIFNIDVNTNTQTSQAEYTMTIRGYPASYRNFRQITQRDTLMLNYIKPLQSGIDMIVTDHGIVSSHQLITGSNQTSRNVTLNIVNNSTQPIREIFIREEGTASWSPNLLPSVISHGNKTTIEFSQTGSSNLYEIHAKNNTESYLIRSVNLSSDNVSVTITRYHWTRTGVR